MTDTPEPAFTPLLLAAVGVHVVPTPIETTDGIVEGATAMFRTLNGHVGLVMPLEAWHEFCTSLLASLGAPPGPAPRLTLPESDEVNRYGRRQP